MEQQTKLRAVCGCGFRAETGGSLGNLKQLNVTEVVSAAIAHSTALSHTLEFQGEVRVLRGKTS
jgi:hypothetical protein